jgi:hypothetical protein
MFLVSGLVAARALAESAFRGVGGLGPAVQVADLSGWLLFALLPPVGMGRLCAVTSPAERNVSRVRCRLVARSSPTGSMTGSLVGLRAY